MIPQRKAAWNHKHEELEPFKGTDDWTIPRTLLAFGSVQATERLRNLYHNLHLAFKPLSQHCWYSRLRVGQDLDELGEGSKCHVSKIDATQLIPMTLG